MRRIGWVTRCLVVANLARPAVDTRAAEVVEPPGWLARWLPR